VKVELLQAGTRDLHMLLPLVRAYHEFEQIDSTEAGRESAVGRLLADSRLGAIWTIRADGKLCGYIALCRGFSIEFNGFDAFVDEFYLLSEFRGRGIGRRVLEQIRPLARRLDINALHLEVARDNERARRLYRAAGFEAREKYLLMSARLDGDSLA
jgi:ribosomal protein S18 acetylase RimI-like enzyme